MRKRGMENIYMSPGMDNLHPLHRQKEPSPLQFKHAAVQALGHGDAHPHERHDQALWRGKEEDIPNHKRMHQHSDSDNRSPPKRFRSSDAMSPTINLMPAEFLMTGERSSITAGSEDGKSVLHKLFEKQLTRSDTGNRFLVPKIHALHCFPQVNYDQAVTLGVLDNQKKRWEFLSCWTDCSMRFVLTKGWRRFVTEKGLREKDVVVFYRFQEEQDGHDQNQHYMIDIIPFEKVVILRKDADEAIENERTEDGLDAIQKSMEKKIIPTKILTRGGHDEGVEEALALAAEKSSTGEQEVMKVEDEDRRKMSNLFGSEETNLEENSSGGNKEEVEVRDMKQERFKEGVWLFGVRISP